MGWTEYSATHFYPNGTVNRKAECDAYFIESLNRGHYRVVKSTMKGSVYYGAVTPLRRATKDELGNYILDSSGWYVYEDIPDNEQEVIGVVVLTYVKDNDHFGYKLISETSGPAYCQCPRSILSLLTPTDSQWANEWRKKCYENANKPNISKLPVGTEIKFNYMGSEIVLRKSAPRYQFKTPFWMNDANCTYFSKKRIPKDFVIVSMPKK